MVKLCTNKNCHSVIDVHGAWPYEVPCVSKVFSSSPRHDALDASWRCVLKHTARCGIPYVSKVVIRRFVTRLRALRGRRFETNGDTSNQSNGHQFQNFYNAITAWDMSNLVHEAPRASSRRLLKHMAHSATPSVSKCACWALRHQYPSIQPISPRSAESFVTKTFETDGTLCGAACLKMSILSAASPIYMHTTHFPTKRRELRHDDFWNRRHTAPRRLFQPISPRSDGSFVTKTFETHGT